MDEESKLAELQAIIDELDILRRRAEATGCSFLSHMLAMGAVEAAAAWQEQRKLTLVVDNTKKL